jgi:hypothetical protein
MARMTMLEMVRNIHLDLGESTYIYTINQNMLSTHITEIVKTSYFNIVDSREWPHLLKSFQLTATSASTPTHMTLPTTKTNMHYVKYNKKPLGLGTNLFTLIKFLPPQRFMNLVDARDDTLSTVDIITDTSGISINIINNVAPTYYTSFDEQTIIFDSYNVAVDSYLTAAKTQCYGMIYPTYTEADDFYLDLPPEMFNLVLNDAKSVAYLTFKGQINQKAELAVASIQDKLNNESWKIRKNKDYAAKIKPTFLPNQGNING